MLIDAHAHLDQYGPSLESALKEIHRNEILTVSVSMDASSFVRNQDISQHCGLVIPTFGVHPWKAPAYQDDLDELLPFINESSMLGEIGLDFHWVEEVSCYPAQVKIFEFFLSAAKEQGKIVNLHTKGAEREVLDLLRAYGIERAIVHWYSGPHDIMMSLLQLGAYFTVGIEVLYSKRIQTIARNLPMDRILTETDNPGASAWLTGTPGTPVQIVDVIEALAELKSTTTSTIMNIVRANWERLVGSDPLMNEHWARNR